MADIIKVQKEHFPALRFIGKHYTNDDRDEWGGYSSKWGEWFSNGYFEKLESIGMADKTLGIENGYLGFMSYNSETNDFLYSIGAFFGTDTAVPEGYEYIDLPESDIAVAFIYGNEQTDNIYGMHDECIKAFGEHGMGNFKNDMENHKGKGWLCFFERYNCPRFTQKDEYDKVILDYGIYINE